MHKKKEERMRDVKVAIVCDPLVSGCNLDRYVQNIVEAFPNSEIFTAYSDEEYVEKLVEGKSVHTTFMQKLPRRKALEELYYILQPFAYNRLKFDDYHIVISISKGFGKCINSKNLKHITVCIEPPTFLWENRRKKYGEMNEMKTFLLNMYSYVFNSFLKKKWQEIDIKAMKACTSVIANSEIGRKKILKHYGTNYVVIYPPVDVRSLKSFKKVNRKENWFLYLGSIEKGVGLDLVIKASVKSEQPLKVVGLGDDMDGMVDLVRKLNAKGYIKFLGKVSDIEKHDLLTRAKALIFSMKDSHFSVIPIEANASGTPVVAYKKSAAFETISTDNPKTGVFFEKYSVTELAKILRNFKSERYNPDNCKKQADNFASEIFVYKLQNYVKDVLQNI